MASAFGSDSVSGFEKDPKLEDQDQKKVFLKKKKRIRRRKVNEEKNKGKRKLVHTGDWINLLLRNVPMLVEVDMASLGPRRNEIMRLAFTQLSCCLHQINILKLDICQVDKIAFPIFANVKYLELYLDPIYDMVLVHLSSFMKGCPRMQKLLLKVPIHTLYLIKNAVALEKFIVHPGPCRKCYPEKDRANVPFVKFEANARADAMKYLRQNFPSSIEFVRL
ncbi:hypothetical protein M0R45_016664 [Rubus argutus]|uniref:Uncharacterized protein n=1 Tax=Rubus argutus TaxID=59490 RepID=A0AAW1XUN0_RUBAR